MQSVLCECVAGCAAVHLLLSLRLSLFAPPHRPPPPYPIQSPSQLPGFVQSPSLPTDQSLPRFLIQHGSAPPPLSLVDSAICPRGSWDFQAHSKYTAENSHQDKPFNLVANQTCFLQISEMNRDDFFFFFYFNASLEEAKQNRTLSEVEIRLFFVHFFFFFFVYSVTYFFSLFRL